VQVESFLERTAAENPHKTALICGDDRFSYRDVNRRANILAHALRRRGIVRGDRVAVWLENSWQAAVSIFAILKAGAVFVVIHPSTKGEKLAHILSDCSAGALITDMARAHRFEAAGQELPRLRSVLLADVDLEFTTDASGADSPPPKHGIDRDLAALVYTSGSTGKSKGVMLTHLNIVSAATSIIEYLENTSSDVILNTLPLSFGYGLFQLLMTFRFGGTLVLERGFTYPRSILDTIASENVTGFPMVPTMIAILLQMRFQGWHCPSLRYVTTAAAALPVHQIARLKNVLPGVKIYSMYGQAECTRVSYLPPDQIDIRPKSVGRGIPNQEVYIVDERGERVPPGTPGELVVRGSHVMAGYWGSPGETDRVLKPGPFPGERVLHTGDLFMSDEEGYLYFISRKDDIIKTRGEKVSPREVEEALYAIEGVSEALVIGVPDAVLGEAVKAVITTREGSALTEAMVISHCVRHLEDFMVPKFVEFRDALPRSANGKINKRELYALATE
jgi:long-chain acyl-CoA synthetase